MRKLLIVIFILISSNLFAQEQETLLSGNVQFGGYGGPVVKFTSINKEFAVLVGGYGGLLLNHSFLIGLGGYGLVNNLKPSQNALDYYGMINNSRIEFGYGGGVLEYIGMPSKIIHYSISTLIGAGGVTYHEGSLFNENFQFDEIDSHNTDAVFAMELNAAVELNITTFFRINMGAGYRLVNGINIVGIKNEDLSAPSVNIALKFGAF